MESIMLFLMGLPFAVALMACGVLVLIIGVLLETNRLGWLSILTILLLFLFGRDIWTFVTANFFSVLIGGVCYVLIGVAWSLVKWRVHLSEKMDIFDDISSKYAYDNDWAGYKAYLQTQWDVLNFNDMHVSLIGAKTNKDIAARIIPKAEHNKALIISWMLYWMLSMLATLLNNPLRKLFNYLYSVLSGTFDRMSANVVRKYE
jgi:hypothetical protein